MLEAEIDDHLGYEKSGHADNDDYRNDYKRRQVNSRYDSVEIEVPQDRKSNDAYPILYINAIHYSVCDNGGIQKLAAYVILSINTAGKRNILTITIGDNENTKYWLSVLNELKNQCVTDILIIYIDSLRLCN